MTWEEFRVTKLGLKPELKEGLTSATPGFMYEDTEIPESIDWVAKCGSCWAFSTTGSVEGINFINTGELTSLSEQMLVDCDSSKDMGCGGGLMDYAFEYIVKNGGLDTEEDYSYWSGWGMPFMCNKRKESDRTAVSIDGYQDVPQDEDSLMKAAANQPIAVGICASATLMFYSGGVLSECCDGLNHGVLLTGFDKDENGDAYYVIKNSWGGTWGEQGFFRLKAKGGGKFGLCGIAKTASYPIKTSDNHPVAEMCDIFAWTECSVGSSCSCSFSFFGLFCMWHDCCPLENGVSCDDMAHCCPGGTTCDTAQQLCVDSEGKAPSVPWTPKESAKMTEKGEGHELPKKMMQN
eukprot:gene574-1992_t